MASKSHQKAAAERRARVEALRKAEQARDRRIKIITFSTVGVILAALAGGGWFLYSAAEEKERAAAAPIDGVQTWDKLARDHVQTDVDYPMTPAVGGKHDPAWANCDSVVYTEEVREENAVHSLEHGAVWISYNDEAADADVQKLTQKVESTTYTFISPVGEQDSPITLSAWGHQLKVKKASDPRIDRFLEKFVQGEQTPEPGAPCTGGSMA